MSLKKPLMIATLTAAVALGAIPTQASAADPLLGALIGGGIGAAIGNSSNRHHGGAVGGLIGAVIGSSIAADSNRYYGGRYDDRGYSGDRNYGERYDDRGYSGERYYDDRYDDRGSYGERYYAPAPSYAYAPSYGHAPYYAPAYGASIVFSSGPSYRDYGHRRHFRDHRRNWR